MKKLMKFIALLGVTTTITAVASYFTVCTLKASSTCNQSFYPETGMVTNANENLITVVCQNGNTFKFKDDIDEWIAGDVCSMIMDNNKTVSVYDDRIVSVRYSGYVNDDEMDKWVK